MMRIPSTLRIVKTNILFNTVSPSTKKLDPFCLPLHALLPVFLSFLLLPLLSLLSSRWGIYQNTVRIVQEDQSIHRSVARSFVSYLHNEVRRGEERRGEERDGYKEKRNNVQGDIMSAHNITIA